jgi:hypothetical protein
VEDACASLVTLSSAIDRDASCELCGRDDDEVDRGRDGNECLGSMSMRSLLSLTLSLSLSLSLSLGVWLVSVARVAWQV